MLQDAPQALGAVGIGCHAESSLPAAARAASRQTHRSPQKPIRNGHPYMPKVSQSSDFASQAKLQCVEGASGWHLWCHT